MKELAVRETKIPGLLVIDLPVHGDERGWFKENWQREKMMKLGLPDFKPVQNNVTYNEAIGVTRGVHAEPWDKLISLAFGKVFAVVVDLRLGKSFGTVETFELTPDTALFAPRGVGNSYQTLEKGVIYTYLVNKHWSPDVKYSAVNLADKDLNIPWPISLEKAELSEKDRANPSLSDFLRSQTNN